MNNPRENAPEDWRKGGYRDAYELAQKLIHSYQGPQKVLRIAGWILVAIAIPITMFLGDGLPTDVALSFAGKQGPATILGHHFFQTVLYDARDPKVNTVWLE